MISVIMPVFNREKFIYKAINSVIEQTFEDWEFIIIDDSSTDKTFEILKKFQNDDHRIKIFRNKKNSGPSFSRNFGLGQAKGEFIVFLDSDDYFKEFAFEKRIKFFEQNSDNDFLVFPILRYNTQTKEYKNWIEKNDVSPLNLFLQLIPAWQTMSPIWRKESILRNKIAFDEKIFGIEDADFHIQALLKNMKYTVIDTLPDAVYTEHDEVSISQKGFSYKHRLGHLHFFKKYFEGNILSNEQEILLKQTFEYFCNTLLNRKEKKIILKMLLSSYWRSKIPENLRKKYLNLLANTIRKRILLSGKKK